MSRLSQTHALRVNTGWLPFEGYTLEPGMWLFDIIYNGNMFSWFSTAHYDSRTMS